MAVLEESLFYIPGDRVVSGFELNQRHIKNFASWFCEMRIGCDFTMDCEKERERNGGFCDWCASNAAEMLLSCPWLEMERSHDPKDYVADSSSVTPENIQKLAHWLAAHLTVCKSCTDRHCKSDGDCLRHRAPRRPVPDPLPMARSDVAR